MSEWAIFGAVLLLVGGAVWLARSVSKPIKEQLKKSRSETEAINDVMQKNTEADNSRNGGDLDNRVRDKYSNR